MFRVSGLVALLGGAHASAGEYTMLVCDEANSCEGYCTTKTMQRHDWHVSHCDNFNAPHNTNCRGDNIKCRSLKYVTISDVAAKLGERTAATESERTGQKGLFVSVQPSGVVVDGDEGASNESLRQLERLHLL